MTDKNDWEFVHSVADEAEWKPGLRKIFDYRASALGVGLTVIS